MAAELYLTWLHVCVWVGNILQYWRLGVAVSDKWEGWQGRYEHRYKMIGSMHATFYRRYRRRGPELVTGEEEIVANSDIGLEKWAARLWPCYDASAPTQAIPQVVEYTRLYLHDPPINIVRCIQSEKHDGCRRWSPILFRRGWRNDGHDKQSTHLFPRSNLQKVSTKGKKRHGMTRRRMTNLTIQHTFLLAPGLGPHLPAQPNQYTNVILWTCCTRGKRDEFTVWSEEDGGVYVVFGQDLVE